MKRDREFIALGFVLLLLLVSGGALVFSMHSPLKADKQHRDTPSLYLESIEANPLRGDVYSVHGVQKLHLTLEATAKITLEIITNEPPYRKKVLEKGQTEVLTPEDRISIRISHPEHVCLRVNGIRMDTKELEPSYMVTFYRHS